MYPDLLIDGQQIRCGFFLKTLHATTAQQSGEHYDLRIKALLSWEIKTGLGNGRNNLLMTMVRLDHHYSW